MENKIKLISQFIIIVLIGFMIYSIYDFVTFRFNVKEKEKEIDEVNLDYNLSKDSVVTKFFNSNYTLVSREINASFCHIKYTSDSLQFTILKRNKIKFHSKDEIIITFTDVNGENIFIDKSDVYFNISQKNWLKIDSILKCIK